MTRASGIYQIRNTVNGKVYVGSAKSFKRRWVAHKSRLCKDNHHSRHLQAAWNKHGSEAFIFEPLITCAPSMLLWYEQQFIDQMKPEYNINPTAGSCLNTVKTEDTKARIKAALQGRPHSVERVAKIRAGCNYSPEWRDKIRQAHIGMKQSEDTKQKKRELMTGRVFSEGSIQKMRDAQKGRTFTVESRMKMSDSQRANATKYTLNGLSRSLSEWSQVLGISVAGLYGRIHRRGWSVEAALSTPKGAPCPVTI